jgi:hypothetical protein
MKNHDKIPSVISYSKSPNGEHQWGSDLSADAICMVHQKLELGIGTSSTELDLLLKTMEGVAGLNFNSLKAAAPIPEYPTHLPEQIVTDYIEHAFGAVIAFINKEYTSTFIQTTPVDVVMTMPAVGAPYLFCCYANVLIRIGLIKQEMLLTALSLKVERTSRFSQN